MIHESALPAEELDELIEAASQIELADGEALEQWLSELSPDDDEALFAIGAWWGERVRVITGWTWVLLTFGDGLDAPALVSADRGVAVLPLQLVAGAVDGSGEPGVLSDALARFARGDRPTGPPGSYALLA